MSVRVLIGLVAAFGMLMTSGCVHHHHHPARAGTTSQPTGNPTVPRASGSATATTTAPAVKPQPAYQGSASDDPRISRSIGQPGGIVLMWPRIIGDKAAAQPYARAIQAHASRMLSQAWPGRAIDVRPDPERVCPKRGCAASSMGILLLSSNGGCAIVAQFSPPGQSSATQVPWAGKVRLKAPSVPFREGAESYVSISDFVPCDRIVGTLGAGDAAVRAHVQTMR